MQTIQELLAPNPYPGRGILLGRGADGRAALGYFIMGRSEKSRARRLEKVGETLVTRPLGVLPDEEKLLLYTAFRPVHGSLVVTNGTHTDTVCAHLAAGGSARDALDKREYEPDPPHYTPRIAGMIEPSGSLFFGILKNDGQNRCVRDYFTYPMPQAGCGYVLHTYAGDGDPLPSYAGAPAPVRLPGDPEGLAATVWDALDPNNRIALYVRFTDLTTGAYTEKLINRFA